MNKPTSVKPEVFEASNDPVITSVVYDGAQVRVLWTPSADSGVTGYVIQLGFIGQASSAPPAYSSAPIQGQGASFGALALPAPLNVDLTYLVTVQAMWGSAAGEASLPVVLSTTLPVLVHAWYDGSKVDFSWIPSPRAAWGYQLIVYSLDTGQQYLADIPGPAARRGTIPASVITQALDPGQQWVAAVAAVGEHNAYSRSPGANFPKPLPTVAPTIALYQSGARIQALWMPVPASNVNAMRMSVTSPQDDTDLWIDLPGAGASSGVLPLPAPLAAAQAFDFRLVAMTEGGAGVASKPSRIVCSTPDLVSVTYTGSSVDMAWNGLTDPAVSGFTLQVLSLSSGVVLSQDVARDATRGSVPLDANLAASQSWVARLIANGPLGAQSGDTPIPSAMPGILTTRCDGHSVIVEWEAVAGAADGYLVSLVDDDKVIATTTTGGTSATLSLPQFAQVSKVQVAARAGIALGASTQPGAPVIGQAPQIAAFLTDPVSGAQTLSWTEVAGSDDYLLTFSDGSTATSLAAHYAFSKALAANSTVGVTVRARKSEGGASAAGPASPAADLPTCQPVLLRAAYDGVNASAAWTPVAGASGYRISVQQASGTPAEVASALAPPDASSTSFAFAPADHSQSYSIGVQARFGNTLQSSTGPMSSLQPLFEPAFFISAAAASASYPCVYPATALATVYAEKPDEAITLYLPQIGGTSPLKELPITKGPFTLRANGDGASSGQFPYLLEFAAGSAVWTFSTQPIRADLQSNYVDFLRAAEQTAGVAPWGISLLQQVISRQMPQTFQETLYYAYGLAFPDGIAGSATADLRPGMVLRVAADAYQAMAETSTLKWSAGYTAGPVIDYDVGSFTDTGGNWAVGFDSFIGQLVAGGALSVSPPPMHVQTQQQGGVADAADLYFPGFRTPFYRLFMPTALATASAPCPTDTPRSCVLAAAATYTKLSNSANTPGEDAPVAYFRGRAVVRPCIRVSLNGNELVVPIGTTVGNLLERAGRLPLPAAAQLKGLQVRRALGPVVREPGQALDAAAAYRIAFDWKTQAQYGAGWTGLTLPLLPGDMVATAA